LTPAFKGREEAKNMSAKMNQKGLRTYGGPRIIGIVHNLVLMGA
jgi:hypothetical protein